MVEFRQEIIEGSTSSLENHSVIRIYQYSDLPLIDNLNEVTILNLGTDNKGGVMDVINEQIQLLGYPSFSIRNTESRISWGASGFSQEIILQIGTALVSAAAGQLVNYLIGWVNKRHKRGDSSIDNSTAIAQAEYILRNDFKLGDPIDLISIEVGEGQYVLQYRHQDAEYRFDITKDGVVSEAKKVIA